MFYRKKRPLYVDGVRYTYAGEAAEKLGKEFTSGGLLYAARHNHNYKGHHVVYACEYDAAKKQFEKPVKVSRKACKVFCETTGEVYPSIEAAAKAIGVSGWTLSMKMQVKGQFVDSNGNVYKRERPMDSKNVYSTKSAGIKNWNQTGQKSLRNIYVQPTNEPEQTVMTEVLKPQATTENIAVKVLKEQAINFVNKGDYATAKTLLETIEKIQ